jgi:hypothetical protein
MPKYSTTQPIVPQFAQDGCKQSETLILQVLEHIAANRPVNDWMKGKLIQAAKNLPINNSFELAKYY